MQDWAARAACRATPHPAAFFSGTPRDTDYAKRICADCPVTAECYRDALNTGANVGIWGGLTPRERREHAEAGRTAP